MQRKKSGKKVHKPLSWFHSSFNAHLKCDEQKTYLLQNHKLQYHYYKRTKRISIHHEFEIIIEVRSVRH